MSTSEQGFGLVEMLVAIAILGISVAMIAGGMSSSVVFSDVHRKQTQAAAVAVAAAEKVKRPNVPVGTGTPYASCATPAQYESSADSVAATYGWTASNITITSVKYWNGTGFGTTCMYNETETFRRALQLVTVKATSPQSRAAATIEVVKWKCTDDRPC